MLKQSGEKCTKAVLGPNDAYYNDLLLRHEIDDDNFIDMLKQNNVFCIEHIDSKLLNIMYGYNYIFTANDIPLFVKCHGSCKMFVPACFYDANKVVCKSCTAIAEENRQINRELRSQTVLKCLKEGCNAEQCHYKKYEHRLAIQQRLRLPKIYNEYCGGHQVLGGYYDELVRNGVQPCANYIRGCRSVAATGNSKCEGCRMVNRVRNSDQINYE
jgi:hypothetical protein